MFSLNIGIVSKGVGLGSLVWDFGGQVVLEDSKGVNSKFNYKGLLLVEAQPGVTRQWGSFIEHIEVSEGELLIYILGDVEELLGGVGGFHFGVFGGEPFRVVEFDGTWADLALDGELDELLVAGEVDCLGDGVEFFAELGELGGLDGEEGLVLSVRDGEVLRVNGDQVQIEFSGPLSLWVLKYHSQVVGFIVCLQCDWVSIIC